MKTKETAPSTGEALVNTVNEHHGTKNHIPKILLVGVGWSKVAAAVIRQCFDVTGIDDFGAQRGRLPENAVTIYDLLDDETCRSVMLNATERFASGAEYTSCNLRIRSPYTTVPDQDDIGAYDAVFLDYDYSAQGTFFLGCAWIPAVRPGGLLCGAKYNARHAGNGVAAGVKSLAKRHRLQITLHDGMIWGAEVGENLRGPKKVPRCNSQSMHGP